jgi:hypothetical protein
VLLAVISGRNTASDSEMGKEQEDSGNKGVAFRRIIANCPSETGKRGSY